MADESPRPASVGHKIVRAMFVVLFFNLFWKLGGFLVRQLVYWRYGMKLEADAFSYSHDFVVWRIFIAWQDTVTPAFLPIFMLEMKEQGEAKAWEFASAALRFSFLFMVASTGIALFFTPQIAGYIAEGFLQRPVESMLKTCDFTVIMLEGLIPVCVGSITYMILNGYKVFGYAAGGDAAQKFAWAFVLVVAAYTVEPLLIKTPAFRGMTGVAIAVGFVVGSYAKIATHVLGLREKFRLDKVCYNFFSPPMVKFYLLALPLLFGNVFAFYREIVTGRFMSQLPEGWPAALNAAKAAGNLPFMLVGYALQMAILPYLCDLTSERDYERFGALINKAIRILGFFFLPLTGLILALRFPIIDALYNFADQIGLRMAGLTADALGFYILILYFYGLETLFMQAFFSMKDTLYPVVAGAMASVFHIAFILAGLQVLGRTSVIQVGTEQVILFVALLIFFGVVYYRTKLFRVFLLSLLFQAGLIAVGLWVLRRITGLGAMASPDAPILFIFFLSAVVYALSRMFKVVLLTLVLQKRADILRIEETGVFFVKTLAVTAAVWAASWGSYRVVSGVVPVHKEAAVTAPQAARAAKQEPAAGVPAGKPARPKIALKDKLFKLGFRSIHLVVPGLVALVVFLAVATLLKLEEMHDIVEWFKAEGIQRIRSKLRGPKAHPESP